MDRTSNRLTSLAVAAGVLLTALPVGAARMKPPTKTMMDKYKQVAIVVPKASTEEGKVLFKRKKMIYGKMPKTVVARLDPAVIEGLEWGERYLFAYTEIRRNLLDRETPEPDPDGPKVIDVPMMGAALIPDRPAARRVFETAKIPDVDLGRDFLLDLMELMAQPDTRTRQFAVAEFYLRRELHANLRAEDGPAFRKVIASPEYDSEVRAALIESFTHQPAAVRGTWLAEESRKIVAEAGTELDLASTWPLLVKSAVRALEQDGETSDGKELARHFGSNSPGVAKAALAAVAELEPDLAAKRAREVLGRSDLQPPTRQAMERFLERYRRGEIGS